MKICRSCGKEVNVNQYKKWVYVHMHRINKRIINPSSREAQDTRIVSEEHYYHIQCFADQLLKKSKMYRNIPNILQGKKSTSSVNCRVCNSQVVVGPGKEYIYILINMGQPGFETAVFYHNNCLLKIVKMESELYEAFGEEIIYT